LPDKIEKSWRSADKKYNWLSTTRKLDETSYWKPSFLRRENCKSHPNYSSSS